jgi:hypothetical protein
MASVELQDLEERKEHDVALEGSDNTLKHEREEDEPISLSSRKTKREKIWNGFNSLYPFLVVLMVAFALCTILVPLLNMSNGLEETNGTAFVQYWTFFRYINDICLILFQIT